MFDSEYFRTILQRDVDALGGSAVVEMSLLNGRVHHLQSVLSVQGGYVTVEMYRARTDVSSEEPRWKAEQKAGGGTHHDTLRAAVSYESIAAVTITAVRPATAARIGFGG